MGKFLLFLLFLPLFLAALEIKQTPIEFGETRVELTKKYIKSHYALDVQYIKIVPKIIVIHHTAIDDFNDSLSRFASETLPSIRADINNGGAVNVSAHFMVERDGTIHQLMPLDVMARHVIGLNYNSIGIENVGGQNSADNLTKEQLEANIALVKELQKRFGSIEYLIGHYEYRCFEGHELWLERDEGYRTHKDDPSQRFMDELRANVSGFKYAPCKQGQK
ncbi:MAG: peptidoglycan recognition family protein [Sulfurimonas sp.]|uniref:N-acetylmuramoyl-L-alanine amidase n=1 Tax=Sulfurimonas sp. TaxID=2022749 RepID=UPI002603CD8C|nr:peptidoglycan recognition family protein [Sulfurimonas sp.]MDD2651421.1 peptidoglycan recognition family protein [Sulfurimonas sp.]MDD3450962.1 peptidoglycan recognition family protein [Sulfurimonas sp.]